MKKNVPTFEANSIGVAIGVDAENLDIKTEYRADPLDWWRAVVDLGAGPNHGLVIGVISSCDGELVEVYGVLPRPLKKGLPRCACKRNRDCAIEWLTRPDGYGVRYAIGGLGDFLSLLEKRAELMQGGVR